jgi:hypothetical protein
MEVKFNPYISVVNIEQNKGKIFDSRKLKRLKGKIVDVQLSNRTGSTILFVEVVENIDSLKTFIGESINLNF